MFIKVDQIINRIKIYAFAVQGWSVRELARQAKIPETRVRDIHDSNWNPKANTIRALESVIPADWQFDEMPEIFNTTPKGEANDEGQRKDTGEGKGNRD